MTVRGMLNFIRFLFKEMPNILRSCSKYLETGTYCADYSLTCIFNEAVHKESISILNNTFEKNVYDEPGRIDMLKDLICRYAKRKILSDSMNSEDTVNGTFILISSSKKEYKIFDFISKQVATFFNESARYNLRKNNILFFRKDFPVVPIIKFDDKNRVIVEKFIEASQVLDSAETLNYIFIVYKNYLRYTEVSLSDFESKSINTKEHFSRQVIGYIKHRSPLFCVRQIRCHGDLWSSNVLRSGNHYFFIDWEHASERYFLYDILMFIFAEEFIKNDERLLKSFFCGEYDSKFSELFEILGMTYESSLRECYFLYFIYLLYKERWVNLENKDIMRRLFCLFKKYGIEIIND